MKHIKIFEQVGDYNLPTPEAVGELKCDELMTRFVDYGVFERYIKLVYDLRYDFAATHEAGNDTDYHFMVNGIINKYDYEVTDRIRRKDVRVDDWVPANLLLNMLVQDGYIFPGIYVVKVSW